MVINLFLQLILYFLHSRNIQSKGKCIEIEYAMTMIDVKVGKCHIIYINGGTRAWYIVMTTNWNTMIKWKKINMNSAEFTFPIKYHIFDQPYNYLKKILMIFQIAFSLKISRIISVISTIYIVSIKENEETNWKTGTF